MKAKFKYSINCTGSRTNKERMKKELKKLGYELDRDSSTVTMSYLSINNARLSCVQNGCYANFEQGVDRDYDFNLDNENEFNSALAISAIRDDNNPYIGEWIVVAAGSVITSNGPFQKIE